MNLLVYILQTSIPLLEVEFNSNLILSPYECKGLNIDRAKYRAKMYGIANSCSLVYAMKCCP